MTGEHSDFLEHWGLLDPDERRRIALEWVVANAGHTWLRTLAAGSASIHGKGLEGVVDALASENPLAHGSTLGKIARLFAADVTNETTGA